MSRVQNLADATIVSADLYLRALQQAYQQRIEAKRREIDFQKKARVIRIEKLWDEYSQNIVSCLKTYYDLIEMTTIKVISKEDFKTIQKADIMRDFELLIDI